MSGEISTGAIAALRELGRTDHVGEMVFVGYAGAAPIKRPEAVELCSAGLAVLDRNTLRLTAAGVKHLAGLDDWKRGANAAPPVVDDVGSAL